MKNESCRFDLTSGKSRGSIRENTTGVFVLHACIWLNEELLGHAATWVQILVVMLVWPALTSHHAHTGRARNVTRGMVNELDFIKTCYLL